MGGRFQKVTDLYMKVNEGSKSLISSKLIIQYKFYTNIGIKIALKISIIFLNFFYYYFFKISIVFLTGTSFCIIKQFSLVLAVKLHNLYMKIHFWLGLVIDFEA